jgi:hydroxymethylpyrimidine pyrophosphatase-like HAD family hydrolase
MQKYKENPNRKVFNIDFDGTLTTKKGKPCSLTIGRIKELYYNGHIIIIWTARPWSESNFLVGWLMTNDVPFHGVMMGKGGSDHYLDDKMMPYDTFFESEI